MTANLDQAHWIAHPGKDIDCPLFRHEFTVAHPLQRARLRVNALGYFDAWMNGRRMGDRFESSYRPFVATRINLDRAVVHLDFNREKLDAAKAKYGNQIGIALPDYLGSVLLTSESDAFSVQEVLNEFEMSPWRDYYAATEKHRKENL